MWTGRSMSASPPPVRGLVAGKYEVLDLIGRGGMGSVWQGRHASLGTRVAIKFVDPEHAQSHEARTRFVTEARAAATIESKHAIQIYDHGVTDDGRPYIVMELLQGEPLDRRIERLGRLSLQETARILAQVCRALQRAHDAGIIHRDLKPENIFLVRSPDEDEETAKVLDFGIAKIIASPGAQAATSSTKTGAVLGTPYYMSPEQARGLRNIDHRTDLWSLGVIAYKCVTGSLPFEGESVGDLLVNICTGPAPVPSHVAPSVPKAFDAWFSRALEREPRRRFSQASELGNALAIAAGLSVRRPTMSQDAHVSGPAPKDAPFVHGDVSSSGESAAITSAPFTASTRPTRARPRALVVVSAAILGATLGVVGVAKLVMGPRSNASMSPDPTRAATGPSSSLAAAAVIVPTPEATPAPASATPTPTSSAASAARSGVHAPEAAVGSGKPAEHSVVRTAPTTAGAVPPIAKPTIAKPSPTGADPGY